MDFDTLAATNSRISAGGWVGDIPHLPGVFLRVRGIDSNVYQRMNANLRPPRLQDEPELTEEEQTAIQTVLIREALLLDWKGMKETFEPETVTKFCSLEIFRAGVFFAATVVADRGAETVEVLEKNSSKPSGGQSPGGNRAKGTKP